MKKTLIPLAALSVACSPFLYAQGSVHAEATIEDSILVSDTCIYTNPDGGSCGTTSTIEGVSFNEATKTLSLNNYQNPDAILKIYLYPSTEPYNISISGNTKIKSIDSTVNLNFSGSGTLTVVNTINSNFRFELPSFSFDGANVNIENGSISFGEQLNIKNSNINITQASDFSKPCAIYSNMGEKLNVSGSNLTVNSQCPILFETATPSEAEDVFSLDGTFSTEMSVKKGTKGSKDYYTIGTSTTTFNDSFTEESNIFSNMPSAIELLSGQTPSTEVVESSYTADLDSDLVIKILLEAEKFNNLYIDGDLVSTDNYTVKSGSTIITIKNDYLKTLSVGDHELMFDYDEYGQIKSTLNIAPKIPNTGKNIILKNAALVVAPIMALAASFGISVLLKKIFQKL